MKPFFRQASFRRSSGVTNSILFTADRECTPPEIQQRYIFTATTLYLKHILSIYDTTISDPQPFRSADFMISIVHLSRPPLCWFRLFRFLLPSTFELSFTFHLFPLAYLLIFQYNNPKVERIWHYYIHRASLCQVGIVKVCCIFQNE